MADNNIPPEGKKIVTRTLDDGSTETVIRDDPNYGGTDCWVATAYYGGDPLQKDVVVLRNARNYLMESSKIGNIVCSINRFYYAIGKTRFGLWWKRGLMESDSPNLRKVISKVFLSTLLLIEKLNK